MARHKKRKSIPIQANYHIVFIPKYRKSILTEPIALRLKEIWRDLSNKNDFDVVIAEIMSDHVHLFMEVKPKMSISDAIQKIKGVSSMIIRKEFPEYVAQFYCKPVFWASKYFVRSVGDITADTAIKYIEFQQDHYKDQKNVSTNEKIKRVQKKFKTLENWFSVGEVNNVIIAEGK